MEINKCIKESFSVIGKESSTFQYEESKYTKKKYSQL